MRTATGFVWNVQESQISPCSSLSAVDPDIKMNS